MSAPSIAENWLYVVTGLNKNWDGNGGVLIGAGAIKAACAIYVVPCSNGGLQIETHQSGIDLEICIEPDGKISSVLVGPANQPL